MSENRGTASSDQNDGDAGNAGQAIRWDVTQARNWYANACNVTWTRSEIALLFGISQAASADETEVTVKASSRVVMSPLMAKRLLSVLNDAIRGYTDKYGPLEADSSPMPAQARRSVPDEEAAAARKQESSRTAGLPLQLVKDLGAGYILGRSFKALHETLLQDRYLLTVAKSKIAEEPNARVLDICRRLNMPAKLLAAMAAGLPSANYVHFGVEESDGTCIYKVYLEFWTNWVDELEIKRRSEPFLGGYGFKWDASNDARQVLTEYTCYPLLPLETMLDRVAKIYAGPNCADLLEIVQGIVDVASSRMAHHRVLYLEAAEENNPRRSYDINTLQARIRLEELREVLLRIRSHFAIDPEVFDALYGSVKNELFGHIAGGTDRAGRDFVTIYYGLEQH
jgi:Protein of unknown function (DUF3467)